jgi:hypothetical protein
MIGFRSGEAITNDIMEPKVIPASRKPIVRGMVMSKENEKKGFMERLMGGKNNKKSSCCSFRIEEILEEDVNNKNAKESIKPDTKKN